MVRSVGIDAGDYSVKLVELDGSYKKLRETLLKQRSGDIHSAALIRSNRGAFPVELAINRVASFN